ncbi:MAG: hypothetical protein KAY37_11030 [Phycisphaerae bacterium]|nr:hypothetical protein [Phycisphaerae bacterium]
MSTGARSGRLGRKVKVYTNDRDMLQTTLECIAKVRVALKLQPVTINFGQISRGSEPQTKIVTVLRGDGGAINPKIVSTGHKQFEAELVELEPGEKYELKVTANPPWPNDMLRGSMILDTGVERSPQEKITVFARITPRLATNPSRFRIPPNIESDLEIPAELKWSDGEPGRVLAASINDPALSVEIKEEGEQQMIVLHVPAGFEAKRGKRYTVKLKTDDPTTETVDVQVYASRPPVKREPGVKVTPSGAGTKAIAPGQPKPPIKAPPQARPSTDAQRQPPAQQKPPARPTPTTQPSSVARPE